MRTRAVFWSREFSNQLNKLSHRSGTNRPCSLQTSSEQSVIRQQICIIQALQFECFLNTPYYTCQSTLNKLAGEGYEPGFIPVFSQLLKRRPSHSSQQPCFHHYLWCQLRILLFLCTDHKKNPYHLTKPQTQTARAAVKSIQPALNPIAHLFCADCHLPTPPPGCLQHRHCTSSRALSFLAPSCTLLPGHRDVP